MLNSSINGILIQAIYGADRMRKTIQNVLDDNLRTKDIMSKNMREVSTSDMGDAIIAKLK